MNNKLFRQKSIDRVSSPEALNDYVKVSSPGVWIVLAAVVVLLIGACVWGVFGRLETTVPALVVSEAGETACVYDSSLSAEVQIGMSVRAGGQEFEITGVSTRGFEAGRHVCVSELNGSMADGVYEAEIVIESIAPASFLWN
ncbi:MAG TPA: hypothetical protein IAD42_11360 [Candidatus Scatomorpha pullistercoris]|uniref:NHLM bacteriocin system secretion protein n=1 Tax=Candidatus Scatomorpha pullistercoris TaxID=2840929 RepID=A0A9D1KAT2_9FIRM|nr:hypothetical protein [Candidatus Scatomorpha pullistercoris]